MTNKQICYTDSNGTKTYHDENGKLHREDGPAIEYSSGGYEWFLNGVRHRVGGPASYYPARGGFYCAEYIWTVNGELHRENGPACEFENGIKEWWLNGEEIHAKDNDEFLRIIKLKAFL